MDKKDQAETDKEIFEKANAAIKARLEAGWGPAELSGAKPHNCGYFIDEHRRQENEVEFTCPVDFLVVPTQKGISAVEQEEATIEITEEMAEAAAEEIDRHKLVYSNFLDQFACICDHHKVIDNYGRHVADALLPVIVRHIDGR